MQTLFDSHCHLDFAVFDDDREALLQRAQDAGVSDILIPGVSAAQWPKQQRLAEQYGGLHNAFGLHPYFLQQHQGGDIERLREQLLKFPRSAIGEIGLDATCDNHEQQRWFFNAQLQLAAELARPVILHHRKTLDEMSALISQQQLVGGVVHAFSGNFQQAQRYLSLGFYLGVGGIITYPRAKKTRATIAKVGSKHLLLETDSPDMPLSGYQGQRNEPARIARVVRELAVILGQPEAELRQQLWQNTQDFLSFSATGQ
ncbi:TatD family hydrolase [Idiomarina xiamenensis]|uniref:Mg-dependent DNase-like protein n=1 Tax=Idiomarina xiamenensis 10-D-4 TaxID=740709 RepID=K2K5K2_9GAMM|nr:TatD family hydrolase [Idiomarina xiamenensis]EKE82873.1 Mg-dependent DNase-like protein [Idiomarina xiamenensis 10-D-4]